MDAISVQHLRVVRGGVAVLPDLSFGVPAGSVTGLIGPSGSGKSTLIRAIVGVQIVAGGQVEVLGEPAGSPGLRRRVAYLTQQPSVYADLTLRENLAYFARVLDAPHGALERAIAAVGLEDASDRPVRTFSGGQLSRASLATALLGEPRLLVLDEPTVGLDPLLRRDLWELFRGLAAGGTTLLVSSHVMDEAERCDRLLLLREGRLLADETPAELRARTGCDDLDDAFLALVEAER
ncbi:MAG TPA: ABC transporter ATP-binding protein [Gaiellaceae bacterium]|jgi:ABC-2 type transport system ATP-binding protein|nr:ABC transporter ATP-binding protein [Gaiellaceae bacterium]